MHDPDGSTTAAVAAYQRGFIPLPIRAGDKKPYGAAWTQRTWSSEDEVRSAFTGWQTDGITNVGLLLGEGAGRLVDVDLDHPLALKIGPMLLPKTAMMTGRPGNPRSHYWYVIEEPVKPEGVEVEDWDPPIFPATRRYSMPPKPDAPEEKRVAIELRSTGGQTVIPPSVWTDKHNPALTEVVRWEGPVWGEPAKVEGKHLARQVAVIGLLATLLEKWPTTGERHDAYLAFAGGMLRYGYGVDPYWEKNLPGLISVIVVATGDEDGIDARIAEVMPTTIARLREQDEHRKVAGFGRLAEIIGNEHADLVKRMARTIEDLSDRGPEPIRREPMFFDEDEPDPDKVHSALVPEGTSPMDNRASTWDRVDMDPYVLGQVVMPEPSVLERDDGKCLFYPGRLNSLYGASESGKSWISLVACQQEMAKDARVMFIDFEDSPEGTWDRLRSIGVAGDDLSAQFAYIHPEDPLADMLRGRFSQRPTDKHTERTTRFQRLVKSFDPTLIVVDGMTTLYNSHGLDTNQAADTDVISSWLKSLTRNGRTTVIVIDHTGKASEKGSSPIGAHHKTAMIQGTSLQVVAREEPQRGAVGEIDLLVHKDRPGAVRPISAPRSGKARTQRAATVRIDSTGPSTVITIEAPKPGDVIIDIDDDGSAAAKVTPHERRLWEERQRQREAILEAFGFVRGTITTMRDWRLSYGIEANDHSKDKAFYLRRDEMIKAGEIEQTGTGAGTSYVWLGRADRGTVGTQEGDQ